MFEASSTAQADGESARIVYERCRQPLLMVIRKVIPEPIRRLEDSDDFLQSTFAKLFTAPHVSPRPETATA
jgi:hypothetical protein